MAVKMYLAFAKQNAEANGKIVAILDKLSNEEREKERGSFYGSLSGLVRHVLGGTCFFSTLFAKALAGNAAAQEALAALAAVPYAPEGTLSEAQWKELAAGIDAADKGYIALMEALRDSDLDAPLALDWYGGKPAAVPLAFMLQQHVAHNIHHRGQISQILDELKIDNDFSGINVAFL
ncbi:MAG: DUF664 domain-containing protein [Spirochaetaceae bacterium]|jgi:uncharacterized damage-inducible protein DinB|nr:DUF664 domain-containing protein [Spirochaetaceae bacterium]